MAPTPRPTQAVGFAGSPGWRRSSRRSPTWATRSRTHSWVATSRTSPRSTTCASGSTALTASGASAPTPSSGVSMAAAARRRRSARRRRQLRHKPRHHQRGHRPWRGQRRAHQAQPDRHGDRDTGSDAGVPRGRVWTDGVWTDGVASIRGDDRPVHRRSRRRHRLRPDQVRGAARGERVAKYNRLAAIETELGGTWCGCPPGRAIPLAGGHPADATDGRAEPVDRGGNGYPLGRVRGHPRERASSSLVVVGW